MKKYLPREDCIELWVLLAQTREAMYKARKKELSRYSISPRQVAVLATIKAIGDKATPAEISRRLVRESHSVGGILDRMEKQGLIRRDKDLERRNLVRVSITEKGQQVYSQVANKESICKIVSALSPRQRQQLMSCLEILQSTALREIDRKET